MKKKLYLGRSAYGEYDLFTKKPEAGTYWGSNGRVVSFCTDLFHKCTDVRLKLGQVVEIKHPIHISIVKEKKK
jgi:hypothetical protein